MSRPLHRVEVFHHDEVHYDPGERLCRVWALKCSCGHTAERRVRVVDSKAGRAAITQAHREHLEAVAPPEPQRCKDMRAHRMRWWDRCEVCAGQMVLPGFEAA